MVDLSELEKYRDWESERTFAAMGILGNDNHGVFKVFVAGRSFFCIASDGGGWEHVSVSPCNRKRKSCPTWEEMSAIKDIFFNPDECVIEYHPPKSEYVNNYPYYLHLWRPNDGTAIPMPPKILV